MTLRALGRLAGAAWLLARNDALLPRELKPLYPPALAALSRNLGLLGGRGARTGRPGERLARSLERLGPVAIKLGQLLSTRADIFGVEFAEDLSRLKDRLAPFPTSVARAEIERSLGRRIDTLFASFGEPVAAASLAQAHEAVLLDGRKVAVKVLRPGIGLRVAKDAEAMALAGALVDRFVPLARRLEPRALAATVIRATALELDLRLEAAGADELREVMARDGHMSAPAIVWDGVGKQVLTMEWAQGWALSAQDGQLMPQDGEFELQRSAAAQPEREQGTEGGQEDEHAYDGMTAAPKTLCFSAFWSFEQAQVFGRHRHRFVHCERQVPSTSFGEIIRSLNWREEQWVNIARPKPKAAY